MALAEIKYDSDIGMYYLISTVGVRVYFETKKAAKKYRSMLQAPGSYITFREGHDCD